MIAARLVAAAFACAFAGSTVASEAGAGDCLDCHRARAPGSGVVPVIAGQRADYLRRQLEDFAKRHRDTFPMREIAHGIDAERVASELAAMPWPERGRPAQRREDRVRAANLVRGAGCATCHDRGFGGRDAAPRLAGQEPDYLARTLDQFASGERIHLVQDPILAWSRRDRRAVADWLARRPGPPPVP